MGLFKKLTLLIRKEYPNNGLCETKKSNGSEVVMRTSYHSAIIIS